MSSFSLTPTPVPAETQGVAEPSWPSAEGVMKSQMVDTGTCPRPLVAGLPQQVEGAGEQWGQTSFHISYVSHRDPSQIPSAQGRR